MNPVEFLELCRGRRSTRQFLAEAVAGDSIDRILECARSIPYASGRKSWEIAVLTDRSRIEAMARAVEGKAASMADSVRDDFREEWNSYSRNFSAFASAPVLFMPLFRPAASLAALLKSPGEEAVRFDRENHIKSISCATMAILLAARAEGLGACPMTGPLLAHQEIAEIAGIRRGYEIAALVAVGRSQDHPARS